MERACQEDQVFGNLPGLCLYCHVDPKNYLGSGSCSLGWLMPILLQLALAGVDQSELKLFYNPWLFPTGLSRAIGSPHLPAPGMA